MLRQVLKAVMARTPYRIVRRAENRFDAFDYSLTLLKSFGYRPKLIIDAGAHLGAFSKLASRIFPDAEIHMIEPQAACQDGLRALTARFHLHPVALGSPPDVVSGLKLAAGETPSTGAHISESGQAVEVATLDELFDPIVTDRTFLKMDLQGFELNALKGGEKIIDNIEVILTEVSFFAQDYEPPISTLIDYLDVRGFDLFDIAALSGRTRDNRLRQGDFIFVRRDSPLARDTRWA